MKVAAVLLLLGLVAMACASYYVPYYPRYYPKAVAVTTVHHGIGYGGYGGYGGFGYGGFGGLGGFGYGGFGGLGGFGGFGGFGRGGHHGEYCEVNESRDATLRGFQLSSLSPTPFRLHTFLFSLALFLLLVFIVSIISFLCLNSISVSLQFGVDWDLGSLG